MRKLTGPTGNLALVETRWSPPGEVPDLDAARAGAPPSVTVTAIQRRNIDTGEPEHGLRFWDAQSAAIGDFDGVDVYEYDPGWVIEADYQPVPGARSVPFEHLRDNGGTRDLVVPGDIRATIDGREYTLSAFDDDGVLLLVFADPTNGRASYGAGRFLFVERTEDPARVTLDFNRAFVPPCGFSEQYNCPMPPPQNRLHVPVEAGEKLPRFRGTVAAH